MTDLQIHYDTHGHVSAVTPLDEGHDFVWDIPSLPRDIQKIIAHTGAWSGQRSYHIGTTVHVMRSRITPVKDGFEELALWVEKPVPSMTLLQSKQLMALTGQLTLGILHKTGNNLTPIASYTALAEASLDDDDPIQKYLESIARNAAHCIHISRRMVRFFFNANSSRAQCELDEFLADMMLLASFGLGQHVTLHLAAVPGIHLPTAPTDVFQIIGGIILMAGGRMKARAQLDVAIFPYNQDTVEIAIHCPIEEEATGQTRNLSLLRQAILHTIDIDMEMELIREHVAQCGGSFVWKREASHHHFCITMPATFRINANKPNVLLAVPGMESHLAFSESGYPFALYRATDADSAHLLLECAKSFDLFVLDARLHNDSLLESIRSHSPEAKLVYLNEPDSILVNCSDLPGMVVNYPLSAEKIRSQILPLLSPATTRTDS